MSWITRREVMRRAGMLAAAGAAPFAMNLLPFGAAAAASTRGYKALVCVFLAGGMDCHDTLLPYDQSQYDAYASMRQALIKQYQAQPKGSSRTRDRLLALEPDSADVLSGRQFALPETLKPLHDLFATGKAAIVANVGPLIQPLNRDQCLAQNARMPVSLFSHNDQQSTWLASAPEGARYGWGGRLGDMALASNANADAAFTAISPQGNSVFLVGRETIQFQVGINGPVEISAIKGLNLNGSRSAVRALADMLQDTGNTRSHLLERDVVSIFRRSIANSHKLASALEEEPYLKTSFPEDNDLARQLNMIARLIAVREAIGVRRQIFFVWMGGFDTHSNQAPGLLERHRMLSRAMKAFYDATVELGVANEVTAFTASDFGRTLLVNGDGTDHGWGGHHFVVGGAVRGKRIIGDPPPAALNHAQDFGGGRLIPTLSVEQYAGSLARWFGLTPGEVAEALPGIANFDPNAVDLFTSNDTP